MQLFCALRCWDSVRKGDEVLRIKSNETFVRCAAAGYAACGAMSFTHCVMREYFSLLSVPFVAKKAGYMEAVGICGAAAMGVCLPIVEKSTRSDVAIYSFISGLVHTLTVPVLIPLLLS